MEQSDYPEIDALNEIYIKHKFEFKGSRTDLLAGDKDYRAATFKMGGRSFDIYIEDEFDDLKYNYPLLNLCLTLRELEGYDDADDYLLWCQYRHLDPADQQVRDYHMSLANVYREVEKLIGKIDPKISDWDFEMGSGAAYALRKKD